MIYLSIG